ncbi:MAG TPA: glycosyltransferase [Acidobacteriota bacterium]|nr:glycosyltransferase [Acidobacteriota bacterium]HQF87507.1 glycosyltransferase [Acidobacteriota bacterium]HQK89253.1 glycosyltransferase [Acidobacteriota bacterium]
MDRSILFVSALTTDSGSGVRFWNMARVVADAGWPVTFVERLPTGLPARTHPGIDYVGIPESRWGGRQLHRSLDVANKNSFAPADDLPPTDDLPPAAPSAAVSGSVVERKGGTAATEVPSVGAKAATPAIVGPSALGLAAAVLRATWRGRRIARSRPWRAVYALKPMPNAVLPALAAARGGARIVLDVDDLDFEYYPPGLQRRLVRHWFRRWPRRFDAVSYHVAPLQEYLQTNAGVPPERLRRITQGVDMDVFAAPTAPLPPEIAVFTGRYQTIVYMASLGITSDFGDVLPALGRILARHADWGLLVLGHGVRLAEFREQAAGLGDRIRFAGYVDHAAVPAILESCRAGFHYLRPEGANRYRAVMKIREYLAAGLPVVANPSADAVDFGDFIAVADDEPGWERGLSAAVTGEAAARTAAGRQFVAETLDWSRLAPDILDILGLNTVG